jgi:hypothetical protein
MRMQEPEQRQLFETTGQDYSAYRAQAVDYEQEQKIYPQETLESRVSVTEILTIIFASLGFGSAIVGLVGSIIVLANRDGLPLLLAGGILGLVGSLVALLFFVVIFVLSVVSAARRAARSRRSRPRRA